MSTPATLRSSVEPTKSLLKDYGLTVLVAITVALFIRFFVIEAYRIPSPSMRPTLEPGDTIFVAKWPFGIRFPGNDKSLTDGRGPRRGEVVVYRAQANPQVDSVRRIVAIAGDEIEVNNGALMVNGASPIVKDSRQGNCVRERLGENEYETCAEAPLMDPIPLQKIPADHVLLMGDYRVAYTDLVRKTPNWQIVPTSALRGSALIIWLSIEPRGSNARDSGWFSRIRFERMLRRIP